MSIITTVFSVALLLVPAGGTDVESCIASVYTDYRTASGQRFSDHAMTAAHKTHAFGTKLLVTSTKTERSVVVTVNDRGPFIRGRCIDLTIAAAAVIGLGWSIAPVTVRVIGGG